MTADYVVFLLLFIFQVSGWPFDRILQFKTTMALKIAKSSKMFMSISGMTEGTAFEAVLQQSAYTSLVFLADIRSSYF